MKRVLQFVALFVVVLLAAQPALAGLPCAQGTAAEGACAPGCAMATASAPMSPMSQMASVCGMAPQLSSNSCQQSCCSSVVSQAVSQPATGAKSRAGATLQPVALPLVAASAASTVAPARPIAVISSAPPRYILLQVFRI